jgi:hypothetical protein
MVHRQPGQLGSRQTMAVSAPKPMAYAEADDL